MGLTEIAYVMLVFNKIDPIPIPKKEVKVPRLKRVLN